MDFHHSPVLLEEVIEKLNIKPDGTYIDGTLGGAGHSLQIYKRLNSVGTLIGLDQDEFLKFSSRLKNADGQAILYQYNFKLKRSLLKIYLN